MTFRAEPRSSAVLVPAVALAFAAIGAIGPPQASAGTSVVRQCDAAGSGLNPATPDAVSVAPTRTYAAKDRCEAAEKALVVDALGQTDPRR